MMKSFELLYQELALDVIFDLKVSLSSEADIILSYFVLLISALVPSEADIIF